MRPALIAIVVGLLALITNIVIPVSILSIWPRDGDTGCWYCGGVLLAQLSVLGILGRWNFSSAWLGRFEWRLLLGATIAFLCILSAWISFSLTGPVGADDSVAFLSLVGFAVIGFGVADMIYLTATHRYIERVRSDDSTVTSRKLVEVRFGLGSMLAWTTLSAIVMCLWRVGLLSSEVSQRDIRSYYAFPVPYQLMLAIYLWAIHIAMLHATMGNRTSRSIWIAIALCTFGLEAMRRSQEYWTVWKLDYLNWEFALIVFGFVTAHVVAGCTASWFGWCLHTTKKSH
jgi:hypothetical protein